MLAVTLMWSIAGVVTRQLDAARSFEVTFWRSAFNAVALALLLGALRGPGALARSIGGGGRSAVALGAVLERDVHRLHGRDHADHRGQRAGDDGGRRRWSPRCSRASRSATGCRARTWVAIVVAGAGIAWMYGAEVSGADRSTCSARWSRSACRSPPRSTGR